MGPNTIINPRAMMIISMNACPTNVAMEHFIIALAFTLGAEAAVNLF
jgi:hypothetical protein